MQDSWTSRALDAGATSLAARAFAAALPVHTENTNDRRHIENASAGKSVAGLYPIPDVSASDD